MTKNPIPVGPLLTPLLPAGIKPGTVVVLSGESGVGVTSLTYLAATHAAKYGHVVWMSAPAEVSSTQLRELTFWLKSAHDNLYTEPLESVAQAADEIARNEPTVCVIDRFLDVMGHRHATQDTNYDTLAAAARKTGTIVWINDGHDRHGVPYGLARRLDDIDYRLRLERRPPAEISHRTLTLVKAPPGDIALKDTALYYNDGGIHLLP